MPDESKIKFDFKGLDQLLKAFKNPPTVRVGILGGGVRHPEEHFRKTGRQRFGKESLTKEGISDKDQIKTNAEIGAIHEFGEFGHPQRSFLRVPISKNLHGLLEDETDNFDPETLKKVIESGDMTDWMKTVGVTAELAVSDAFDTGGDGAWIPSNMEHKKNHQTLVETAQLRRSITSAVKK